jgi:hypothetical protein
LGERYRQEDVIPPIIDKTTFEEVQKMHVKRKRMRCSKDDDANYILTTKLFCGHCGEPMTGESARGHTQMYYYYTCIGKKRRRCNKKRVKKEDIEELVIKNVTATLCNDDYVQKTIDDFMAFQEMDDSELISLRATLRDVQKAKENVLRAIEQGIITPSTKDRLMALESRENDVSEAIARHEVKTIPREVVEYFFQQIREGNIHDTRFQMKLVDIFVDKIFLYDDKMTIAYRMGEKHDSISYNEVRLMSGSPQAKEQTRTFYSKWCLVTYAV